MRTAAKYLMLGAGAGMLTGAWMRRRSENADITGQVVVITGGSRGLGLALAREFAEHECRLAICSRDAEQLNEARASLEDGGAQVYADTCDVGDRADVERFLAGVREHYGRIDILVNNAGEMLVAPVENTSIEDFERAMQVMFWGVVYSTMAVLPQMRERGRGRIANITSVGGKVPVPHLLAYSCAKAAAVAFGEGLRAEMAPYGVAVTTIAPGLMRTGGHVNARVKGQESAETAWFATAASVPGLTMSAERAAEQTVRAIRYGVSEKVLSTQASLLARVHGAFPGLVPKLMTAASVVLPHGDASEAEAPAGSAREHLRDGGSLLSLFTALGRRAGARLNQRTA